MKVLFLPVSGRYGMGEYARCAALAHALLQRWPQAQLHFALSEQAPYAATTPFAATLLPSSPTFHTAAVRQLIRSFRPDVTVFDNAGRTAQLRAAVASGARVVFISSRLRQRRRAFRLKWMRLLDVHWIAYPSFICGELGPWERLKLRIARRPQVAFLDAILPAGNTTLTAALLRKFDLRPLSFVLVVGGGGTAHPGAESAPAIVSDTARRIATQGHRVLLIGDGGDANPPDTLTVTARMPIEDLAQLLRSAKAVVCNGGDTLLQALSCHKACVAAPIAADQPARIQACVREGLAVGATLDAADWSTKALELLGNEPLQSALRERLLAHSLRNALPEMIETLGTLAAAG